MDHDRYCCRGCRRRTVAWWSLIRDDDRPDLELYLCGVHSDAHADALARQGWVQVADERGAVPVMPGAPCAPST